MSDQQKSLARHNQARASAQGINRPPLKWDAGLAKAAQAYAQHLAKTNTFKHSGAKGQGENLYMSSGAGTLVQAATAWINEKPNYHGENIPNGSFGSYGHYTQVIWPSTTHVGVGKAVASNGATYIVGRYTPPGNIIGQSAYGSLPPAVAQVSDSEGEEVQAAQEHVAEEGDTMWKVSQVYRVPLENLKAANSQVEEPDSGIPAGELIRVPGAARGIQRVAKAPAGYTDPSTADNKEETADGLADGDQSSDVVPDDMADDFYEDHGEDTDEVIANGDDHLGDHVERLTDGGEDPGEDFEEKSDGTAAEQQADLGNGALEDEEPEEEIDGTFDDENVEPDNEVSADEAPQRPMQVSMMAVQSKAASGGYTVVAGDSMWLIAKKLGVSVEALEAANPQVMPPAYEIHVGQVLKRPGEGGNSGSGPKKPHWYSGPASNFPGPQEWISWDKMAAHNAAVMNTTGNSKQETQWVLDAIQEFSKPAKVDRRGILAVVMQESHGNVRVNSTTSPGAGIRNAGLMQSHNGVSFKPSDAHGSIRQMIKDGACGVPGPTGGDGLQQLMARYHNFFVACRGYNSGDGGINMNNLSDGGGATSSYCSDIANRLKGIDPN